MDTSLSRMIGGAALLVVATMQGMAAQAVKPQSSAKAQPDTATRIEIYGFAQADAIGDFRTNNPDWFDVNRPSKLPAFQDEFGHNGHTWFSARQSRFGAKATIPTSSGKDIKVVFDWDLFGVGVDAGQTTIRPRHMYGQWGDFGGGQLESPFMDLDVFPNIIEYWGPDGMLFYRNVQVFWQPVHRDDGTRVTLALERPGASGDAGVLADRIELQNIKARFPAPDISGEYRLGGKFGYAKLGAIVRWIRWDDLLPNDAFDLNGGVTGWGVSLSTGWNASVDNVLRLQAVYGAGVENYFNDAPVDVGAKRNPGNTVTPVTGEALPDFGLSAYLDHKWNSHFTSAIGYSRVD
ncbi:MAG TPA: DcaP family trimeric outer membrane transporter, partial [Gemmatimonadaceae bacterium]|nr:DcaP family trimeric outer membrane transporter [Gemmatimonadaceae bacterium]